MKIGDFNTIVRELLKKLVQKGYPKHPMCAATLGAAANPQFDRFMKGTDLGAIPMGRLVDGLGYELCVIPVKQGDTDAKAYIEQCASAFLGDAETTLVEHLENRPVSTRNSGGGPVAAAIEGTVKEMIFELDK